VSSEMLCRWVSGFRSFVTKGAFIFKKIKQFHSGPTPWTVLPSRRKQHRSRIHELLNNWQKAMS